MDVVEKNKIAEIQKEKEKKIRKSLDASVKDGMAYNVMQGSGMNFISAFAIALKATNFQISMLNSLPQLLSAWVQLFSAALLEKFKNRKKLISIFVLLQAITWLPMIIVPFFFLGENAVWFVILFYVLFNVFGAIIGPIWQSLMGDLVPVEERGTYFGKRNSATGAVTLIITLFSGFYLNLYPKHLEFFGFAALFVISFLARMISRYYLGKMYEPAYIPNPQAKFTFTQFVAKMSQNNFGNFVLFVSCLSLAVNIAAPFFAVNMLRILKFDYLTFTLITIAPLISSLFMMAYWGRITDRFGNRKVMSVCGIMVSLIPLYWLLFKDPWVIFLCEFFVSGFFWAGFNLAAANFIFDTTTPEKRTRCAAYFNIFNGTGVFIGAMIGGLLASIIPENFNLFSITILNLYVIFAISFIARLGVYLFFINRIKEVRPVEKIEDRQLFYTAVVHNPIRGFTIEMVTTLKTTAQKETKRIRKVPRIIGEEIEKIDKEFGQAVEGIMKTADKAIKKKKK